MRYRFWRYRFGPRQCLGKNVADILIKVLLAYMVEDYDLSCAVGDKLIDGKMDRVADTWIASSNATIACDRLSPSDK
ncbi:unnamed protein product [Periconia digitata]|uniref:Uncharacterized protein n=1 Tax=Periconia digitata TaxID=1303443 RepID=A0A9W4U8F5_9PLEO|nr:unnamed protein product [Periconia digitata]